jgi:hypothetical protein
MMSRTRTALGLCAATLSVGALVAAADAATSTKYSASMSGAQETPANGSKATGKTTITVTGKRLCYVITSSNLGGSAAAAHIHKGAKGKNGPVFIAFFGAPKALKNGKISGCVTTTTAKAKAIAAKPSAYYANVHTVKYPSGAMRGQLKKS